MKAGRYRTAGGARMSKAQLVDAVASAANLSKADAGRAVDAVVGSITSALRQGQTVAVAGFGTFGVKRRAVRTGRNPRTGEEVRIPARKAARLAAHAPVHWNLVDDADGEPRALDDLRAQARAARESVVSMKQVLPSSELTSRLGITRQALNKAVHAHRIFSIEQSGVIYYPAFYADPHLDRAKLERVTKALGHLNGWDKWQFFTRPKASLGDLSPLAALRDGRFAQVLTAAAAFTER